jgi:hypothetical protein
MVSFPAALIIRHTIDEQSALFGVTLERLEKEDAFFIASTLSLELVMAASTKQSQYRGQNSDAASSPRRGALQTAPAQSPPA